MLNSVVFIFCIGLYGFAVLLNVGAECPAIVQCPPFDCTITATVWETVQMPDGEICHGCPRCAVNESWLQHVGKRQLTGPALSTNQDGCPLVDCLFVFGTEPCKVPELPGTIHYNGLECPGCPYCPLNPDQNKTGNGIGIIYG